MFFIFIFIGIIIQNLINLYIIKHKLGKCGCCAINVNGKNVLACNTPIDDKQKIQKISPLPNIPVIKDLVLDLTHYYEQYKNIQPWIMRKKKDEHGKIIKEPDREILQTTKERKKLDGYYECNLCACCSSSCPNYWRDAGKCYLIL